MKEEHPMETPGIYRTEMSADEIQKTVNQLLGTNLQVASVLDLMMNPDHFVTNPKELDKIDQLRRLINLSNLELMREKEQQWSDLVDKINKYTNYGQHQEKVEHIKQFLRILDFEVSDGK